MAVVDCCWSGTVNQPAMADPWSNACVGLLDYKTEKFALTRNRKVGALHRLIQLGILGYILGWVFLVKKGYQERDTDPHVSVITKLKGISVTHITELGDRLWDVADYVKPPQGENVFFLVTNFIATPRQVQGSCPEHPSVPDGICKGDMDCAAGQPVVHGNGIKTGKCVSFNTSHRTCEIYGWCPVENQALPRTPLLGEAENFTLFIKNAVNFTRFNFSRTNTLLTSDEYYFKGCQYDAIASPLCPVFRICDMVKAAGENFDDLALQGGAIALHINWNCDLDRPPSECQPHYSFHLLDKKYNFRTASYYRDPLNQLYRSLLKLYGIRFDISVHGQAGKFSIVPTAVNLGTGAAFLGVSYADPGHDCSRFEQVRSTETERQGISTKAAVVCDLVLLYLDTKAEFYRSEKYEEAKPPKDKVNVAT